ncbi:response regulator transcription factor [Streptomyces sp. MB09-02B]|nr:response regulator transcription factor [Streptomyces sp. MB09-02B]MDX3645204.1 response regulator transcription factor [Streptomyces sp. MB09-02B]
MGVRVLLIEDDETIAEPLADGLRHFGLTVHHVATGADGLRGPHGDVVLLDLGLPDMDGIDVCRGIRRTSDVPIIILSARGEEADRVLGLELGADDYLAKPFSIRELVARIRAVSRRHQHRGSGATGVVTGEVTGEVVAGVVAAEAGAGRTAGAEGTGGSRPGADPGVGGEAGYEAVAVAGSSVYGSWAASAPESSVQEDSATGNDFGIRGRAGGRSGSGRRFGADSDFAATGDGFGAEERHRAQAGGPGGAGGSAGVGGAVGAGGVGGAGGAGGPGDSGGAEYDWSAAYETPARGTPTHSNPAHGTPTYADPAHHAPAFGSPAPGASTLGGPAYGTPAYGELQRHTDIPFVRAWELLAPETFALHHWPFPVNFFSYIDFRRTPGGPQHPLWKPKLHVWAARGNGISHWFHRTETGLHVNMLHVDTPQAHEIGDALHEELVRVLREIAGEGDRDGVPVSIPRPSRGRPTVRS